MASFSAGFFLGGEEPGTSARQNFINGLFTFITGFVIGIFAPYLTFHVFANAGFSKIDLIYDLIYGLIAGLVGAIGYFLANHKYRVV